ncbi:MAG TPA: aldolase/citrate lyase family protein [Acidimicrobiales bacterium]
MIGPPLLPKRPPAPPLRSVLFVPGSDDDAVHAAVEAGADALIIDLEEPQTPMTDAVRERARSIVAEFLDERSRALRGQPWETRPLIFCRVQPARTGQMWADLLACLRPALTGIVVPKSYGPDDLVAADAVITNAEATVGRELGSTWIYPIFETAQAIRLAYEIAVASPRVAYMGGAVSRFGDIHQALGYRWTARGTETHWLRSKLLADARAAGIRYPISGMWGGGRDELDELRAFATELRDLGYYGMMLGDAVHISLVHEVFTPTPDEVAYWQTLVALGDEAARTGVGPVLHGDPSQGEAHVVHGAHVESARLNLEWARALGLA